ncbi:hypothetical protein POTOM_033046 [Populus tomentosa]|uniref:Uncharacterized protein n=1 Tax=Populus tomentosa TaxID=118781 RepID=A0A8X7Z1B3_POPTO|nr:hypothetical protein POTOM_033046 [Populus tomentosa]
MEIIWTFMDADSDDSEAASKHSATVLAAACSAWSFLLTAMEGWRLSEEHWQGHVKFLYFADIPLNGFQHEGARSVKTAVNMRWATHLSLLHDGLATEVAKINTHLVQREEAMKKSRELLFNELCNYLALDKEEVKKKWSKMDQEERRVLVKGFVNEWSANFHPLSARSVKEMIEEYLHEEKTSSNSSRSMLFPGLKRIMGFSE